jgi:hypothetical protein
MYELIMSVYIVEFHCKMLYIHFHSLRKRLKFQWKYLITCCFNLLAVSL